MSRRGKFVVLALIVCLMVQLAVPVGALAASSAYTLVDIVQLARALSGSVSLDASQQARLDLNGDGYANILDLSLIAQAVLAATQQATQNTAPVQRVVCDTCHQYPCVCHSAATAVAQPTVCPNCSHYPCACSTVSAQPAVCGTCHQYPCVCHTNSGSVSSGAGSTWTCGTCHQYPCVCSGSGNGYHHSTSSGNGYHHTSSGHHGSSHC